MRVDWRRVAVVAACLIAAVLVGGLQSGSCGAGDCTSAVAGGPAGWLVIAGLLAVAVWAVRGIRVRDEG